MTTRKFAKKKAPKKAPQKSAKKKAAKKVAKTASKIKLKKVPPKKIARKVSKKATKKAIIAELLNIDLDVKNKIIANCPLTGIEPDDLTNDMTLTGNLSYTSNNKAMLTIDLDKYVNDRKSSAHVTSAQMTNVKTVGDTIKLIKTKLP